MLLIRTLQLPRFWQILLLGDTGNRRILILLSRTLPPRLLLLNRAPRLNLLLRLFTFLMPGRHVRAIVQETQQLVNFLIHPLEQAYDNNRNHQVDNSGDDVQYVIHQELAETGLDEGSAVVGEAVGEGGEQGDKGGGVDAGDAVGLGDVVQDVVVDAAEIGDEAQL